MVREEWEKEKDFFPPRWFRTIDLRFGALEREAESWFASIGRGRDGGGRTASWRS